MRKQTDFVYRQLEYSAVDPNKSTQANSQWIRNNYLAFGYEVLSTAVVRAEANSVFLGISFVKWEDVPDSVGDVEHDTFGSIPAETPTSAETFVASPSKKK